jgi:hydroxyacylglutathione hydrolase
LHFERFKTPGIAHVAYLFGDKGEAAVVDPRRDVDEYLKVAREKKLTIKFILETHRQEDFVIGSSELAKMSGGKIVSLDHELFGHSDIRLKDGEELHFGPFKVVALHTPGHTPESTSYAVYLDEVPGRAWAVFTGDTLFIGEAGRTDLTDPKKTRVNAGILFDSIQSKLLPLGDQTLLCPAHGAGSVCGGNIADRDQSSLGLERTSNPAFTKSREQFMDAKLHERIPRPPYFSLMEKVNLKGGLPLAKQAKEIPVLQPKEFASEIKQGIVFDGRDPEAWASGHIPGSLNIWLDGMAVFGGWVANQTTRVYLVLKGPKDLETAVLSLGRLGVDGIDGVLAGDFDAWRDAGQPIERAATISPRELSAARKEHVVLDVRDDAEFEDEGHIPEALHLYVGYLDEHLHRIKKDLKARAAMALVCSVGHRAGLAASILRRHGYDTVTNLLGGMTAWKQLELPIEKGADGSVTTPDVEGQRQ